MKKKAKILFVEDTVSFRQSYKDYIEEVTEHQVFEAGSSAEAIALLDKVEFDLMIVDNRLVDNDDELDESGLRLAQREELRHIPKIILSAHPVALDSLNEATAFSAEKLPLVMEVVGKRAGPKALVQAIDRVLATWPRLSQLNSEVLTKIEEVYSDAQKQARLQGKVALYFGIGGFLLVIIGMIFVMIQPTLVTAVIPLSGVLIDALVVLFYARLDRANERVDLYQRELYMQIRGLEILLAAAENLPPEQSYTTKETVIKSAAAGWFSAERGE